LEVIFQIQQFNPQVLEKGEGMVKKNIGRSNQKFPLLVFISFPHDRYIFHFSSELKENGRQAKIFEISKNHLQLINSTSIWWKK